MIYPAIAAGAFLLDLILKTHIDKTYARSVQHPHLKGIVILEKYYNRGAALNLLSKRTNFLKFANTALLLVIGVFYYFSLRFSQSKTAKTGLSLLLGGGLSNLYDRYTKGYVIDYFRIHLGPKWLRRIIFNISDFCIFIGALLTVAGISTCDQSSQTENFL